jgi:hypothetical protein
LQIIVQIVVLFELDRDVEVLDKRQSFFESRKSII